MWEDVIASYLASLRRVGPSETDAAEQWAANASMFAATASWRLKLVSGVPWLRLIRVHSHWAERANVLRLVLLSLAASPPHADFELVYVHNDLDPTPAARPHALPRPPLFTNARRHPGGAGLPLPDFTWLGWRSTPPWCQLLPLLSAEARRHPWHTRDPRAFFSGGLDNGAVRRAVRRLYLSSGEARAALALRDAEAGHSFRWPQYDRANRSGGLPPKQPPLPPSAVCRHQFALSLPGFGYASRLRALLACGALVLHVPSPHEEFFAPALRDGEHLVVLRGRDPVGRRLLPTLRRLAAEPRRAAAIAAAGQRFAQRWLAHGSVVDYTAGLLRAYAARFDGEVRVTPDDVRLRAAAAGQEDEQLRRVMGMCHCVTSRRRRNASAEERQRRRESEACMAQGKGQRCRPWPPRGGGRCFAPKCCQGWDCGVHPLECPTTNATSSTSYNDGERTT
ncbi:hypothetical protein AB1Y20_004138 [Prymnesium parvum]|uniref:Glycosyl transferase CAP10 domain-containing protein n=1 Tax=Prymnesium parvum TaxID=97485 RepID=A0AB34J6S6_PRYPA